ncbi:MAG: hypothetical protein HYZ43_12850 [Flavobacteriia bacterium]|nr:hypothetical protein [Flavobacteriia bacterium]
MSEVQEAPKRNTSSAMIAVLVLLVVGLGIFIFLWSSKNSALNDCNAHVENLQKDSIAMNEMMKPFLGDDVSNDLMKDFENMMETYDALIKKDATQSDSLNVQKEKIQNLMSELETAKKGGKVNASLIAKLKRENETLRQIMIGYVKQIDELNTLNLQLESELDETTNELTSTQTERDTYKTQSEVSEAKVKAGSKLKAYGFTSEGLRMKINNTPEPTSKARNCVQVRSSFTIGENEIAEAGPKTVYLQITDPDGKVLQGRSGNTVQTESGTVAYSDKKEITYNNKSVDLSIYYDFNGAEPVKGAYKVKVFCDGQLIGTDGFSLK